MTDTTTAPDRRSVFKQIAATLGGALVAAKAMDAKADPLVALNAERVRLAAIVNDPNTLDAVADAAMDRVWEIRETIEAAMPVSPAGAAVQLQLLKERMQGFHWCEYDDRIADNLITGLFRMGAAA